MRKLLQLAVWASLAAVAAGRPAVAAEPPADKIKVLIIDGQNNHDWRSTTPFMKRVLEDCGRFTVDVATTAPKPGLPPEPKAADDADLAKYKGALDKYAEAYAAYRKAPFNPDLGKYQVILSNYNGEAWPEAVQKSLDDGLKEGKFGLVIVHAADNSFPNWDEYNHMIGLGWRDAKAGERIYYDEAGKEVRQPKGEGNGSGHRAGGDWTVTVRDPDHPITKGMPAEWLHASDELYDDLRGPGENMQMLATAYSKGTKVNEPMIWTVTYGKGRVFHTPMGHDLNAMRCVGFITTLRRGTEWAATGQVTLPIPGDFPTAEKTSSLPAK